MMLKTIMWRVSEQVLQSAKASQKPVAFLKKYNKSELIKFKAPQL